MIAIPAEKQIDKKVQETFISFELRYIIPLQSFFHYSDGPFQFPLTFFKISKVPLIIKIPVLNSSYPLLP